MSTPLRQFWIACLCLFALSACVAAQTTEADIAAKLVGKPLLLRGFWAADNLSFHADGTPAETYSVGPFTESAIDVKSVAVKGDLLVIEGQRVGLVFDKTGSISRLPLKLRRGLLHPPEKMVIQIHGGTGGDFLKATSAIFTEDLADIANGLPEYWQPYARQHFLHEKPPAGKENFFQDAPDTLHPPLHVGGSVTPPRVVRSVDPAFTEAGRQEKFSGESNLYLWIGESGEAEHIRIAKPLGLGLDEQAIEAVQQYKFAPAMQNGHPVRVELYISVNFRVF